MGFRQLQKTIVFTVATPSGQMFGLQGFGFGLWVLGLRFRVLGFGFMAYKVYGFRFSVQGLGFQV